MPSGFKIIWSAEAENNLSSIIQHLEANWTARELKRFFSKLDHALKLISKNPKLFERTHRRRDVRRCVLSKQISIYYKIGRDNVYILSLFDNRQDLRKLPLVII